MTVFAVTNQYHGIFAVPFNVQFVILEGSQQAGVVLRREGQQFLFLEGFGGVLVAHRGFDRRSDAAVIYD